MIIEIGDVLVSMDILTEKFCCDLEACKGRCCVEGDAGAPVLFDEIADIEQSAEQVWDELSASAQAVIDKQGVVYADRDGDLVTSIIGGRDCVFTCYKDLKADDSVIEGCCLCALEKAFRKGATTFQKPISCALYPIREKRLQNGMTALSYHQWDICAAARRKGTELDIPVYRFLRDPLVRRFGEDWVRELETVVAELKAQGYVK